MKATLACGTALAMGLLMATAFRDAAAQDATAQEAPLGDLPGRIRQAKSRFHPVTPGDLAAARENLRQSVDALNRRLREEGANGDAWRSYLRLDDLLDPLAHDAAPDPDQLRRLRARFVGNHAGLQRKVFTDVRRDLAACAQVLDALANPSLREDFETHAEALAEQLEAHLLHPGEESRQQIAAHLGWMERHGQAGSVVDAIRQRLSRPNLLVRISEEAIAACVHTPVDETGPVREQILGTDVVGSGRTVGHLTASLLPDDSRALLLIELIATNRAETIGYNGPVRVHQQNRTELHGRKPVIFDSDGFHALSAESTVSTSGVVTGLGTTFSGRLRDQAARRRAREQIGQQKPRAEAIMEGRQASRLNGELDRLTEARLADANAKLKAKIFHPLIRLDAFPGRFDTKTSEDQLLLTVRQATASQLAAPGDPPPLSDDTDLTLQLHRSAVENAAAHVLAGRTISAEEMAEMARQMAGESDQAPAPAAVEQIAVTLAETGPLTLRIDDGQVALTVRGRRFIARNRSYPAMNVTVRYRLEQAGQRLRVSLAGAPEIVPPRFDEDGPKRFSAREAALRRLLLNHLDRDLKKEITFDPITPEGELAALGTLRLVQLVADNGWLTLAFRRPRGEPTGLTQD